MGKLTFVAWLFIMAFACFALAVGKSSAAWFLGSIVLLAVGVYASRQLQREADDETVDQGVSLGFFGKAILLMLAAMLGIFWVQFSA